MTVYIYLRVSSDDQSCENQKQGILKFCEYKGFKINKEIREEGVSGKISYKQRKLGKLIKQLKKGDILIVSELSRLSREMTDCFEITKILNDKQVEVYCVKENLKIGNDALGLMIMSVFAFSAQIERERISERTREALQKRKNEGVKLGRKQGYSHCFLDAFKDDILQDLNSGLNKSQIAKKYNCTWSTLHRWIDKNNL